LTDGFFTRLARRSVGDGPRLVPAPRSRYEPGPDAAQRPNTPGPPTPPPAVAPAPRSAGPSAPRTDPLGRAALVASAAEDPPAQLTGVGEMRPDAGERPVGAPGAESTVPGAVRWEHEEPLVTGLLLSARPGPMSLEDPGGPVLTTSAPTSPGRRDVPNAPGAAGEPTVHVHIGRIDVRAVHPPARPPEPARPRPPRPDLADHLRARDDGRR